MYSPDVGTSMESKGRPNGFTLVELLVVISIIAVLLTMLLPSLQAAKQQAQGALCVAHLRSLSLVWTMYADDNEGRMVWSVTEDNFWYDAWANMPIAEDGSWLQRGIGASQGPDYPTLEDRLRGIRAGALFPYTDNNTDIYHCPGDKRMYRGTSHGDSLTTRIYRSYVIQQGLNGPSRPSIKRLSGIKRPEETYVFVEEDHNGGTFNNNGGFIVNWQYPGWWWSKVANWHNASGTLGYADGHAERRVWEDERTRSLKDVEGWFDFDHYQPDSLDLQYFVRNYGIQPETPWYEW